MHTPVLSIGDGIVKEIAQTHKCGGIHAANLAKWNSVSVSSRNKEQTAIVHLAVVLESGIIVDYLHILADTARVQGYIVNTFEGDGGKTQFFHNPYRAETSTPREVRWEAEDREGGFVKMAGKPRMPTTLDGPGV
ncbi:hypothetical protein AK812_SmicGene8972 [Symbiodinium microadriaticum]|uniref:Uncharacterized protein n=1 Tax=Symbiodinium microadriaticum TaxID=2951 RepID=A0A1Q9EJM1_SYMMI|nr:hypothetical protein AK812_SmicGene8972 [Symbiodinium microadriaticum]